MLRIKRAPSQAEAPAAGQLIELLTVREVLSYE
jgi:hypothetical protein